MSKRDYRFGVSAGLLMGLLALPIAKAIKPASFTRFAIVIVPVFLIAVPLVLALLSYVSKKNAVIWQIGTFAVIGVLNTLVDWGALTSLVFLFRTYFHIDSKDFIAAGITLYSLCKAFSFVIANANSYYWNKYWTFAAQSTKKTKAEVLQFFLVSSIGFLVNVFIASFVFGSMHAAGGLSVDQRGIIGAAAGSIAGLFWNFLGYKFIVFKE